MTSNHVFLSPVVPGIVIQLRTVCGVWARSRPWARQRMAGFLAAVVAPLFFGGCNLHHSSQEDEATSFRAKLEEMERELVDLREASKQLAQINAHLESLEAKLPTSTRSDIDVEKLAASLKPQIEGAVRAAMKANGAQGGGAELPAMRPSGVTGKASSPAGGDNVIRYEVQFPDTKSEFKRK